MQGSGLPLSGLLRSPVTLETLAAASTLFALAIRPRLFSKQTVSAQDAARDRAQALINESQSVLCLVDGLGVVRGITPNAGRILGEGCERAVQLELTAAQLLQAEDPEAVQEALENLLAAEPSEILTWTFRTRSANENHRVFEVVGLNRVFDAQLTGLCLEIRDVTAAHARAAADLKRIETNAESASFYDAMTGVSTARLLRERARQLLALARRHGHTAALLHVDLNGLKGVNGSLGRDIGDQLLRKFADRLKQGLRESDTICRLDGDEFLILLSDVAEEDATARVVLRLRESVCRPFQIREHSINLGATFGVALYPQDATTFDEMLEYASLAMKRAQATGTGYQFFRKEITAQTLERLSMEDDLKWAWERKQFVLHYQPVIGVETGRAIGAEALTRAHIIGEDALARWPHLAEGQKGQISPAQFIPVAERTGRIVALDRWAIAAATRQASVWAQEGWKGWVSVNLSARSLHDADLPAYIQRCFETNNLAPGSLVLEVTEHEAMRDIEITARILNQLKDAGALIALDDFGVGHSSLAYLKHFPVDVLKLDHNFVKGIGHEKKHEHLIETMISLSHRIGASVVAEGVEQDEQMEFLRNAECDFVQGYLFGKAEPPETLYSGMISQACVRN